MDTIIERQKAIDELEAQMAHNTKKAKEVSRMREAGAGAKEIAEYLTSSSGGSSDGC